MNNHQLIRQRALATSNAEDETARKTAADEQPTQSHAQTYAEMIAKIQAQARREILQALKERNVK